jgi:hypothetical protein
MFWQGRLGWSALGRVWRVVSDHMVSLAKQKSLLSSVFCGAVLESVIHPMTTDAAAEPFSRIGCIRPE